MGAGAATGCARLPNARLPEHSWPCTADLLDGRADELVLPVVGAPSGAADLGREVARAGEDRLDVRWLPLRAWLHPTSAR